MVVIVPYLSTHHVNKSTVQLRLSNQHSVGGDIAKSDVLYAVHTTGLNYEILQS